MWRNHPRGCSGSVVDSVEDHNIMDGLLDHDWLAITVLRCSSRGGHRSVRISVSRSRRATREAKLWFPRFEKDRLSYSGILVLWTLRRGLEGWAARAAMGVPQLCGRGPGSIQMGHLPQTKERGPTWRHGWPWCNRASSSPRARCSMLWRTPCEARVISLLLIGRP